MPYRHIPDRTSAHEPGASTTSHVAPPCPACGAAAAVTTARIPSESSYWRCVACGEVWTPARRQSNRRWSR